MELNLSKQDIDYIARVAETEVDHGLKRRNPEMYNRMTQGVVDTILNRVVSKSYPNTVEGVVNQRRQFSKITGPKNLRPYGSVQNTPKAGAKFFGEIDGYIKNRSSGQPSSVGGNLNYANPHYSTKNNLGWINALSGPKFGQGKSIHHHGTTKGTSPVDDYKISIGGQSGVMPTAYSALPSGNDIPKPQFAARTFAAPRGLVEYGAKLEAPRVEVASLDPSPVGYVQRAGSLPQARPALEANPKAQALQQSYWKRDVPIPAPTPQRAPAYTPKASDYSNYMMSAPVAKKAEYTPKASDYANYMMGAPAPTATPQLPQTTIAGPIGQPVAGVPIPAPRPTKIDRFKQKAGSKLREHFKPQTVAARVAGGLIGGPMGAMAGPKIAQFINQRGFNGKGLSMPKFASKQPLNQFQSWGNNSSNRMQNAMSGPRGATNTASNGSQATSLGNGQYTYYSPKSGKTSVKGEINMNKSADLRSFFGN